MGYYNITECLIPKLSELKILAVLEMCKEDLPSYSHNRTVQYRVWVEEGRGARVLWGSYEWKHILGLICE